MQGSMSFSSKHVHVFLPLQDTVEGNSFSLLYTLPHYFFNSLCKHVIWPRIQYKYFKMTNLSYNACPESNKPWYMYIAHIRQQASPKHKTLEFSLNDGSSEPHSAASGLVDNRWLHNAKIMGVIPRYSLYTCRGRMILWKRDRLTMR